MTVDADATVLTGWEKDEELVDALLASFASRQADGRDFALRHRIPLLRASSGTHLDVALGALPFEQRSAGRASSWRLSDERELVTCGAEDLVVHKAFAAHDRDWVDIDGVLLRQGATLNVPLIWEALRPLVALKEEPAILERLEAMMQKRLPG